MNTGLGSFGLFSFLHTMKGPDFLWLFVCWFALSFATVLILRWRGQDTPFTTAGGILCFEALGVVRIIVGSAHGMHKWDYLILMMIVGAIAFLIRAEHFKGSGKSGSSWWSCGDGGCGGGGRGGG